MELNQLAEIDKMMEIYERERFEAVSLIVKKYVIEKLSSQGWTVREGHVLIGRHFNFAVIGFINEPQDFLEILTPLDIWEEGGIDREIDLELEKNFTKHINQRELVEVYKNQKRLLENPGSFEIFMEGVTPKFNKNS